MFKLAHILKYLSDKNTTFALGVFDADKREWANQLADEYYAAGMLVLEIGKTGFEMEPGELMMLAYRDDQDDLKARQEAGFPDFVCSL